MKVFINPDSSEWEKLIAKPQADQRKVEQIVIEILQNVKAGGDAALKEYTRKFDNVELDDLRVSADEIERSEKEIDEELKSAILLAKENIEKFHRNQSVEESVVETMKGITCWRKNVPIEKVGLYIPAGSAPLFSTVLMLGIPAKLAGCNEIVLCTAPQKNGQIHPAILYTAALVGIKKIYKVGGAQAVAAMAFGTETIPAVYKIFGPGNLFVTKAKEMVQQNGVAIDMPAGPSELLIIADETCNPAFVAADLLSQAEHGADSQVVLLGTQKAVVENVIEEVQKQLQVLPRKEIAAKALENSFAVIFNSLSDCMAFSNFYAPEHLSLAVENPERIIKEIINAGSVFIGHYSCESVGDYAGGTNHTLPTNGYAKSYSGVSVESFMKKISFQQITEEGIQNIGTAVEKMAEAETLFAHKNAVTLRLKEIRNG